MSEDTTIKDRLEAHVQKTGNLSSEIVSAIQTGKDPDSEQSEQKNGPVKGAVNTTIDAEDFNSENQLVTGGVESDKRATMGGQIEVPISEYDRNVFLDALVSGDRMRLPFSIYGGKLQGTIRARTVPETRAIISVVKRWMDSGEVNTRGDYDAVNMPAVLAAQIADLNGTEFPCMEEPLMYTVDNDGNDKDPGWIGTWKYWYEKPENMIVSLFDAVKRFEYKYWTMVGRAEDQNFWSPAEST